MERDETTLERHNRILLEDAARERQRLANDQGYAAVGGLTDGFAAALHAIKARSGLAFLLGGVLVAVASLVVTGSVIISGALLAVAVGLAVAGHRKRGTAGRPLRQKVRT